MPKQKDLKRVVRSRMKKTGESYTSARAQVIRKKTISKIPPQSKTASKTASEPKSASKMASQAQMEKAVETAPVLKAPISRDLAKIAGMSDDAVHTKTGKTWAEWVQVLDHVDAAAMPHREIATHVYEVHAIDGWWAQTVTVGYERIKGVRDRGQRRDGKYEASKSRTFRVPVETLYAAFATSPVRKKWLGDVDLTVRKASPLKSIRMTWPDQTSVEVWLVAKGEKSQATIQHTKLASKEAAAQLKAWWNERFDKLAQVLAK